MGGVVAYGCNPAPSLLLPTPLHHPWTGSCEVCDPRWTVESVVCPPLWTPRATGRLHVGPYWSGFSSGLGVVGVVVSA